MEEPNEQIEVSPDEAKPEGLLYHYTDQKGLEGILGGKNIQATHVRYLNDESEFVHGWEKAWNSILEEIRKREFPGKDLSFKKSFEKVFSTFCREVMKDPRRSEYYVACFTCDNALDQQGPGFGGDRLSLWRGYSKGGFGFSLGFDADALKYSFTASGNAVLSFRRCEYSESNQNAQIEALTRGHVEEFLKTWGRCFSTMRDHSLTPSQNARNYEPLMEPLMNLYADFVKFGMFMKHHGFREENEWRATFIAEDQAMCSFREGALGLTPFLPVGIELSKSPSPLKRIVVGPGRHKDQWVTTVNLMLAKCSISGVEVVPSQIPYRNW
jgi:hypothetical protein